MAPRTVDQATLDPLDRRLVCALQLDGRAEPGRIAAALGVSVRTVTRRLARLRETGVVRVVLHPAAVDDAVGALLLRVRVLQGRVDAVAQALAARSDVPFVDVMLGGQEVGAVLVSDQAGRDGLLYRRLPVTGAVTETTVYAALHLFADAAQWHAGLLTPEETAALTPARSAAGAAAPPAPVADLDPLDSALLAALAEDARCSAAALAATVGAPESTVRRRLHRLDAAALLRTHVTVDPRLLGFAVDANLYLALPPGRLAAAGAALAVHPQVHGVVATSGPHNLMVAVFCPDHEALYRFTTEVLGPLGVERAETVIVGRAVKRAGARVVLPKG
jgi:DNA-binding Lrp family transcriptional regulator